MSPLPRPVGVSPQRELTSLGISLLSGRLTERLGTQGSLLSKDVGVTDSQFSFPFKGRYLKTKRTGLP